jgi:prepilin-type N-terminal cleavage/methylation domain-containing protein
VKRPTTRWRRPRPGGFTLVELLIVMVIIGILLTFILAASYAAVGRAEQRATQALITKLDVGVTERLDALTGLQPTVTGAHRYLGAIFPASSIASPGPWGMPAEDRARVIAMFDLIKAEMPDVFWVDLTNTNYPLNFAAVPYPNGGSGDYSLPIGNNSPLYAPYTFSGTTAINTGDGGGLIYTTTGIYGASFVAAGGFYKNLGYLPAGYDGVDNNGNTLIDEFAEGIGNNPVDTATGLTLSQLIQQRLHNHDHKTARAEALYAFLVEGLGPLGSIFRPEDFTDKEVRDTDNDGMPEFVDAWGEPLQFYRWPIHYRSGIQHGAAPYSGVFDPREQDPLDTNQQLMSPAWWAYAFNNLMPHGPGSGDSPESPNAFAFENFFHRLIEPNPNNAAGTLWDRGGSLPRRAYFSRPLISSGGPDRQQGIARLGFTYPVNDSVTSVPVAGNPGGSYAPFGLSSNIILIENTAATVTPVRSNDLYLTPVPGSITSLLLGDPNNPDSGWAYDDITNQTVQSASGASQ